MCCNNQYGRTPYVIAGSSFPELEVRVTGTLAQQSAAAIPSSTMKVSACIIRESAARYSAKRSTGGCLVYKFDSLVEFKMLNLLQARSDVLNLSHSRTDVLY